MKNPRYLIILLVLAVVFAVCSCAGAESGTCGDNITWNLDENGTLTISGSGMMAGYDSGSSAPWSGYADRIKSVEIEKGITSIGTRAFADLKEVTSVSIPSGVTWIEIYAFSGCSKLAKVNIPAGVTNIESGAFRGTAISTVSIPASVEEIPASAFSGCQNLKSITVNSGNANYIAVDGVLFNKDETRIILYPAAKTDASYTIPGGVTTICDYAFAGSRPGSVTIPSSLNEIGECAFEGCKNLKSIDIPGSVGIIGPSAFEQCSALAEVTLHNGTGILFSRAFYGCGFTDFAIPDSVNEIFAGVFSGCKNLSSISVGSGNTAYCAVNGALFTKDKEKLIAYPAAKSGTTFTVPAGVGTIEARAFESSTLRELVFPDGLWLINNNAFICPSLTKITLPASIQQIEDYAFSKCKNLSDVYYSGTEEQWEKTVIFSEGNDPLAKAKIHYNAGVPVLSSVKFSAGKAAVKEKVTITAVTNTNAVKLVMYANNKEVKAWTEGFTDQDDKRTWKVSYAFAGAGERELVFYAVDKEEEAAAPKTAKITITKAAEPKLTSVKFNKATATVKQKVTITAVTTTDVTQLNMYSGKTLAQSWKKGYTDKDGKRTWKVTYAFAGAGNNRKLTFKGQNKNGKESAAKTATITVTKAPTLSSVKFSKAKAKVKEKVTITAVTSTNATKLTLYAGTKAVKSWTSGYTDKDGKRTWKVTYSFSGAGKRTITFKAFDANGAATAGKNAGIEIVK